MTNKNITFDGAWSGKLGGLVREIWFGLLNFARENFEPLDDSKDIGKVHYYINLKDINFSVNTPTIYDEPDYIDHVDIYTDEENAEVFVFGKSGYSYNFYLLSINLQAYILDYIEQNFKK